MMTIKKEKEASLMKSQSDLKGGKASYSLGDDASRSLGCIKGLLVCCF